MFYSSLVCPDDSQHEWKRRAVWRASQNEIDVISEKGADDERENGAEESEKESMKCGVWMLKNWR